MIEAADLDAIKLRHAQCANHTHAHDDRAALIGQVERLLQERDAALMELAAMKEALKPFAAEATHWKDYGNYHSPPNLMHIRVFDLRAAEIALANLSSRAHAAIEISKEHMEALQAALKKL